MDRICEQELMDDPAQALAYARADFTVENSFFVDLFQQHVSTILPGSVLDIGCGPGDILMRIAQAFPRCHVIALDGAPSMIRLAEEAVAKAGLESRVSLRCDRVQTFTLPGKVHAAVSNSLLHHLADPLELWSRFAEWVEPGGPVLVMDLLRPSSVSDAHAIVDRYAAEASPQLRRDFYHSLLAACTRGEVSAQLARCGLDEWVLDCPDDRHWVVRGRM